ncbi:PDR/VanB family oxidoreductase [Mycolicibacterium arenosum]
MGFVTRRHELPTVPGGHGRAWMLWFGDAVVTGLFALSGAIRKPVAPAEVDRRIALVVADREVVAHDQDVIALRLTAPDDSALPRWYPGAHIDVHLPSGRVRQYSLCGDPADTRAYRIAVRRIPAGGGGSIEVHDEIATGTSLFTSGPRNAFPLAMPGFGSPTQRFRFIAGGIGITPILPMLATAERHGVDWSMVYAGRSVDALPFVDELARFGDRIEVRTDDVHGVPSAADLLGDCPDGTTVYACGPAPMLTAIRSSLVGRADVELHFERFAAPPVVDGEEFTVAIASTGEAIRVAADETLLAALNRSDVHAPYSCQQGFCGTCRTAVRSGDVDHRDTLLTEPERAAGTMLICVSRARGDGPLVLDL